MDADKLADLLREHNLRLVILNASKSGLGRRGKDIFNGVAQGLIRTGVPAVLSTPFTLDRAAAVQFISNFYRGLCQGKSLAEIIDRARQRLRGQTDIPYEWYRPVLYLRHGSHHEELLFTPSLRRTPTYLIYPDSSGTPPDALLVLLRKFLPSKEIEPVMIEYRSETIYRSLANRNDLSSGSDVWWRDLIFRLTQLRENIVEAIPPNLAQLQENDVQQLYLHAIGVKSIGFATGSVFVPKTGYRLNVVQSPDAPPLLWKSDDVPGEEDPVIEPHVRVLPGKQDERDCVVIVCAGRDNKIESEARAVGTYFGEMGEFELGLKYNSERIKQLLREGFEFEDLGSKFGQNEHFRNYYNQLNDKHHRDYGYPLQEEDTDLIINKITGFAERRLLLRELVSLIKQENPRLYDRWKFDLSTPQVQSQKFKGVLFLDLATAFESQSLKSWEAVAFARASRRILMDFVREFRPENLHLFLSVPFGLAVFLGQHWKNVETQVQCYEWVGGDQIYAPTCLLDLRD